MKTFWRVVSGVLLAVFCVAPLEATQFNFGAKTPAKPPVPIEMAAQEFPLGEKLVFDVFWIGIRVGRCEIWAKEKTKLNGREVYHVVGRAEANSFLSRIYPVKNEAHSWIDAKTMMSLQFQKSVREGQKPPSEKTLQFKKPAHDAISVFYWARRQPLEKGTVLEAPVRVDEKKWSLELRMLGRETVKQRRKPSAETILVEPKRLLDGKLDQKGRAWVNLTPDASRLPLRIRFQTPFGPVVGLLVLS